MSKVYDERRCILGEGPLWHPVRQQFFWLDILNNQLLSREKDTQKTWQFEEHVSAAGWISRDELLIASESKLFRFHLETRVSEKICDLEADNPVTRSNDGRADPMGGFWIGTMGKNAEVGAGSIYRFYKSELRKLFTGITISNAICFAPNGKHAYFADTIDKTIQKVALDADGWPSREPELFIDLNSEGLNPDGAVVDSEGNLWNAQWGAHRVACYTPNGDFAEEITFSAEQISCPAFGGPELNILFATSAAEGLTGEDEGRTYAAQTSFKGQREHRVLL